MIVIVKKTFLFLSSYIPLYIMLAGKEIMKRIELLISSGNRFHFGNIIWFNSLGDWMISILMVLSIILSVILVLLINRTKKSGKEDYLIVDIENETDKHYFNYLMLYFLPSIGLSIGNIPDVFVLITIMIIIGIVYVSNELIYINPMLTFGGFKVYSAEVRHISNSGVGTIRKIIISNCPNAEGLKGKMVKLAKSNTRYTLHYHIPLQEKADDE